MTLSGISGGGTGGCEEDRDRTHCCRRRSTPGWLPAPRPSGAVWGASRSDLQLLRLSLCPHGLRPASRAGPSALLDRARAPGTLTERRGRTKGGAGAWRPLGVRLATLGRSLVTCRAVPSRTLRPAVALSRAVPGHTVLTGSTVSGSLGRSSPECSLCCLWLMALER